MKIFKLTSHPQSLHRVSLACCSSRSLLGSEAARCPRMFSNVLHAPTFRITQRARGVCTLQRLGGQMHVGLGIM